MDIHTYPCTHTWMPMLCTYTSWKVSQLINQILLVLSLAWVLQSMVLLMPASSETYFVTSYSAQFYIYSGVQKWKALESNMLQIFNNLIQYFIHSYFPHSHKFLSQVCIILHSRQLSIFPPLRNHALLCVLRRKFSRITQLYLRRQQNQFTSLRTYFVLRT